MTSTEVAHRDESSLELLPPSQPPSVSAQRMLLAHAEMMQTAYELASRMVLTTMVPTRFARKPEDATAAILYGAELGLNPIQSLQRIIPIHGMPSLEARTMVALLKSRGYKIKTAAQSDTSVTVTGRDLDNDEYESTWTIERAIKAGYVPELDERTGKYKRNTNDRLIGNEKYITDPQAMLKAKAQAEVCRDMAPEVLLGIAYTSEELESERFDDSALTATEKPTPNTEPVTVEEILGTNEPAEAAPDEEAQGDPETQPETPAQPQPQRDTDEKPFQEEVTPEQDPEPEAVDEPEQEKSQTRLALERRLFKLLAIADIARENRADRLLIYRDILGLDTEITSTNDLTNVQVAAVCDQLYTWDKAKELGLKVTDILNRATLAESEAAEAPADADTTEEGN